MLYKAKILLFTVVIAGTSRSFAQQGNARDGGLVVQQASYIEPSSGNLSANNKGGFIKDAAFNKTPATRPVNDSLNPAIKANNKTTVGGAPAALPKNAAGSNGNNMAKGFSALANNITGIDNTAHGYMAMQNNTTGVGNTAIGVSSLHYNTTGQFNTANGSYALASNTTGERNTAFGTLALSNNTSGSANTAVGYQSLLTISAGENNTAVGHNALTSATIGSGNTSIGTSSLFSNKIGNNNTAIGTNTLNDNFRGSNNVATGVRALAKNMNGDNNTAIGYSSLTNNVSGSYNTVLGYSADVSADGLSNATALGSGAKVSASNSIQLGNAYINNVNTSGTMNASGLALNADLRLRQNITPVENGLSTILKLNPVRYERKNSLEALAYSKAENGFIAQEIQKIIPFIVSEGTDKDKLLSVDYISIIPVLTKAIQEQQAQIQQQSDDIKALKKLVQQLLEKK